MQTMNERPTPETNLEEMLQTQRYGVYMVKSDFARRLERERDEAREWQTFLSGWGGTPEIVHEFIKGQQTRIYAAQEAERERDEALDAAEKSKAFKRVMKEENAKLRLELDELNKRLIEVCQYGVVCTVEREDLHKEVAAERALADKLARALDRMLHLHDNGTWSGKRPDERARGVIKKWKEARK